MESTDARPTLGLITVDEGIQRISPQIRKRTDVAAAIALLQDTGPVTAEAYEAAMQTASDAIACSESDACLEMSLPPGNAIEDQQ